MLLEKCDTKNRKRSIKQKIKFFNFLSKITLDHPVQPDELAFSNVPFACDAVLTASSASNVV